MAIVGHRHDLNAQLVRGGKKVVVAVAVGGQKQQERFIGRLAQKDWIYCSVGCVHAGISLF